MDRRIEAYVISAIVVTGLLIGCSSSNETSAPAENVTPSVSNTLPAPAAPRAETPLEAEYREAKTAFEQLLVFDPRPDVPGDENREISLSHCDVPFSVIPPGEVTGRSRSLYLAFDISYSAGVLRAAGVPDSYWRPRLEQIERQSLPFFEGNYFREGEFDAFDDDTRKPGVEYYTTFNAAMDRFTRELNSAGLRRNGTFHFEGECGGNEVEEFELTTAPEGSVLYLISRWSTLVCQGRGIPVLDRSRCRGWRPVATPSVEPVTGDLLYSAQWGNGSTSNGEISFRNRSDTGRVTITPRGPTYQPRNQD